MVERSLIDYTKFKLKSREEIRGIFGETKKIFVFWCGKCYKRFEEDTEEEYDRLSEILEKNVENIAGQAGVDFLCNNFLSKKIILDLDLSSCDSAGVISCGLGIQFVAQLLEDKMVYALADSIPQSGNATSEIGYHGISLEKENL